ncbi:MAG TPA: uroporphyrinogen decarboxylase family protein [Methanomassiliicoccaceae archaeon]|jgi:[methyl-Co(III) methanol-specific corrinoid protein]:coenzyme M methyltransferase|nr:uroporphyrinogen decarboxylase family protein [Methanomassiliicoccaceae archaeon]HPT73475.1 uroporphyrinogen decarboxylase family protein [Methanomassiliicoccaceae archaeon]HQA21164.1 uroporphyrinogen decarboxylase family protein [Methanomassiliicoccaceae archaeon]HQD88538.1 uroporphyrinogen decarboxylase family protein [Methanomassiliicoccaceae archaeon]
MVTNRERMRAAFAMDEIDRPAVIGKTVLTPDTFQRAGADPVGLFDRPKDLVALAKAAVELYGFENWEIFQIWSHTEFLGVEIEYNAPNPYVRSSPYTLGGEFEAPDMDAFLKDPKIQNVIERYRLLRKAAGKDEAISGITSWGPLTMAGHLVGTENLMFGIATDPDEVKRVIQFCAEFNAEAYKMLLSPGNVDMLDYLAVADPTASGDMLSTEMFVEYALPYNQIEQKAIRSTGMLTELHICGDTTDHLPFIAQTGANAISIEQKVDPYKAYKLVGDKVALCGNVGPIMPLLEGTVDDVRRETQKCIDAGFRIISPGCSIAAASPAENLRAMAETVKQYGRHIPRGA